MVHTWLTMPKPRLFEAVNVMTVPQVLQAFNEDFQGTIEQWKAKYLFVCGGVDLCIRQNEYVNILSYCYGSPPSGPSSRPPRNRLRHRAASDICAARHPSARDRSIGREFPTEQPQVHLRPDRTRTMGSLTGHMTAGKWSVRRPP